MNRVTLRAGTCNNGTLQHTATHYNTLQLTATHCNTLQNVELAPEVTARIPLRTNFDDRYFSDRYQVTSRWRDHPVTSLSQGIMHLCAEVTSRSREITSLDPSMTHL